MKELVYCMTSIIKRKLVRLRSKIIHSKVFYQRALGYISIINSTMILFLLLSNLKTEYGFNIDISKWFFPILLLGIAGLVTLGYIEDRLGFYRTEQEAITRRNPQIQEILNRLDTIDNRIRRLSGKKR